MKHKNYILIRDDDISSFTPVEWLARVHEPLLRNNLPVNFAVIPNVRSDIKGESLERIYLKQEGLEFEPFIPPKERGKKVGREIGENSELCQFLKNLKKSEMLQHGFTHAWRDGKTEFALSDKNLLNAWIIEGSKIIKDSLGINPKFFVPPCDNISREAVEVVNNSFMGISLKEARRNLFPFFQQLFVRRSSISERCLWNKELLLVGHPGYAISRFNSAAYIKNKIDELVKNETVIVLVVHHWEFFFDWGREDSNFLSVWHEVLNQLINSKNLEFITFSELYSRLKGN